MKGGSDAYSLRVGDYRVIFTVDFAGKKILVYRLGTRREIEKHY